MEIKGEWLFFKRMFLNPQDISDNKIPKASGVIKFPGVVTNFPSDQKPNQSLDLSVWFISLKGKRCPKDFSIWF